MYIEKVYSKSASKTISNKHKVALLSYRYILLLFLTFQFCQMPSFFECSRKTNFTGVDRFCATNCSLLEISLLLSSMLQ